MLTHLLTWHSPVPADGGHQLMVSSLNEVQLGVEMEFDRSRQFDLVWHVVVPFSKF